MIVPIILLLIFFGFVVAFLWFMISGRVAYCFLVLIGLFVFTKVTNRVLKPVMVNDTVVYEAQIE